MSHHTYTLELKPYINRDNMLTVRMVDSEGTEHPFKSLAALAAARAEISEVAELVVRVPDFYHDRAVYRAYGITLERDRRTVAAHWQRSAADNGVEHRFSLTRPGHAGELGGFVIGARPTRAGMSEPVPYESSAPRDGDQLPIKVDKKQGGTGHED